MPQPDWEALDREVRDLARRVTCLEQRAGLNVPLAPPVGVPENHPLAQMPGMLPIVGRALLGLAGAYLLLRALTETGTLSASVGIVTGIVYALLWLGWAARTANEPLKTAFDSLTAVLVLSPLLWEGTVRFQAIGPWTSAATLFVFAAFGMAISWRKSLLIVSTFATLTALGTGAALLMATHNVLPFTFLFLAVGAAIEAAASMEHRVSGRWLGALAADLSVLVATWLGTNEHGLPEGYAAIPYPWLLTAQVALLTIYLASTIVRTLLRGFPITRFETAQCAVAFVISLSGGLRMATPMAVVMLLCAVTCYLVCFAVLERRGAPGRNFYTYSTFGILLALAGSRILLSNETVAWVWSFLAIACMWAAGSFGRLSLQAHGAIYLLLALFISGAMKGAADLLLGAALWPGERQGALWAGLAVASVAYALVTYYGPDGRPSPNLQVFRIAIAGSFLWLAAGIVAGILTWAYHMVFGTGATHAYCGTLRTGVLAGFSLVLAFAGTRRNRPELSQLIYPAMLLGGYRLLVHDMPQGHTGSLFVSLLLYGAALTALPRLKRLAA